MTKRSQTAFAAIALSLGLTLSGCGAGSENRSLNSVNQPVVERSNFALDLATNANGLAVPERARLADWFQSMNLRYGDRVAIDGSTAIGVRDDIAAIAGHHGLLLSEGAPVSEGYVAPGAVRVVVTRTRAVMPNCPNWSDKGAGNYSNATSAGFGCSVNGNLAAMVADPEHLLHGADGNGETVMMSSTKAIQTYREKAPTGAGGLPSVSSKGS